MSDDLLDPKTALRRYLQEARESLLAKLEGLSERDARLPRTPTGVSLTGLVRHVANVEIGYFGDTFGRPWPAPEDPCLVPEDAFDEDPQADWFLPADVPSAALADFYRRVWSFADQTLDALDLDARGRVPWWGERGEVTLHRVLVHVLAEVARHAGHADILREGIDGATGDRASGTSLPDGVDWPAYVAKLTAIADTFPSR